MSAEWIRFEDGRSRQGMEYATIMKDGRLMIGNDLATKVGLSPGTWCDIFYSPDTKKIGIQIQEVKTPYSVRLVQTGPKDHPFNEPLAKGRGKPGLIISLRSFLNSRHIGLSSKVKGHLYYDLQSNMIVFEFPDAPQIVTPSEHAGNQLVKSSFHERIAGDTGQPKPQGETNHEKKIN